MLRDAITVGRTRPQKEIDHVCLAFPMKTWNNPLRRVSFDEGSQEAINDAGLDSQTIFTASSYSETLKKLGDSIYCLDHECPNRHLKLDHKQDHICIKNWSIFMRFFWTNSHIFAVLFLSYTPLKIRTVFSYFMRKILDLLNIILSLVYI